VYNDKFVERGIITIVHYNAISSANQKQREESSNLSPRAIIVVYNITAFC